MEAEARKMKEKMGARATGRENGAEAVALSQDVDGAGAETETAQVAAGGGHRTRARLPW